MFNGTVQSYDVKTGSQVDNFKAGHQQQTYAVTLSQDRSLLACHAVNGVITFNTKGYITIASHQGVGKIHLWDLKSGEELPTPMNAFGVMAFSPDNTMLAASSSENIISLAVNNESTGMHSIGTSGSSDHICLWNVRTGLKSFSLDAKNSRWWGSLVFSPDKTKLASTAGFDHTHLWHIDTQQEYTAITDNGIGLAFSSDSRILAIRDHNKVHLWEIISETEMQKLNTLDTKKCDGNILTFSPGGKLLLLSNVFSGRFHCSEVQIQLWDIETGEKLLSLPGHTEPIETLVFSHDGKILASGSEDGTVLLWDWNEILRDAMLENRWPNNR